jgi:hypothetical protein
MGDLDFLGNRPIIEMSAYERSGESRGVDTARKLVPTKEWDTQEAELIDHV